MFTIHKRLRAFSAAHRLIKGYTGKCRDLHGHNYSLEVTLTAETLDQYDFVIDFDAIKAHLDTWVQDHWDHATLISAADHKLLAFIQQENQSYFVIPGEHNTTAERLAEFLFHQFTDILKPLFKAVKLTEVRVYESETAWASYQ
jgi:6-pyruvoyltetrahydropterin/6-carboxytetrahydropterin synthase